MSMRCNLLCNCRIAEALIELNRKEDAMKYLTKLLESHFAKKTNYKDDSCLLSLMQKCKYFSKMKNQSVNWNQVKYQDNCVVVDQCGAGDLTSLHTETLFTNNKVYTYTATLLSNLYTVRSQPFCL